MAVCGPVARYFPEKAGTVVEHHIKLLEILCRSSSVVYRAIMNRMNCNVGTRMRFNAVRQNQKRDFIILIEASRDMYHLAFLT